MGVAPLVLRTRSETISNEMDKPSVERPQREELMVGMFDVCNQMGMGKTFTAIGLIAS